MSDIGRNTVKIESNYIDIPTGRRETLLQIVTRQMARLVLDGHYKTGEQLPSEFELAKKWNVARGTVREALKTLTVVGLLQVRRGKGTFVADRSEFFMGPLLLGINPKADLITLVKARELIEIELVGLAATHRNSKAVRTMREALKRMRNYADIREFYEADLEFHFAIALASGNPFLSHFLTLIRNLMAQWMAATASLPGVAEVAVKQHEKILKAVQSRNPNGARAAMNRHLEAMAGYLAKVKEHVDLES